MSFLVICTILSCPFPSCTKEYVCKHTDGCLKHFCRHLKDPICVGDIKKNMLKYAKDHGMMKTLQKRGYVVTEVVAAQAIQVVTNCLYYFRIMPDSFENFEK